MPRLAPLILQSSIRNSLISALCAADFSLLQGHLTPVDLMRDQVLSETGVPMTHCCFPEQGIVSVIAMSASGRQAEVGLIGFDGMIDIAACLGASAPRLKAFVQLQGHGYRVPIAVVRQMVAGNPLARQIMLRYAYAFLVQVSHTAFVNAQITVEARLARWLLMYLDRIETDTVEVTHEFLSLMLGIRRAGVTIALGVMRTAGLVTVRRSAITVLDRAALEVMAGDAYGAAESLHFDGPGEWADAS
jgi:CRP-like cAMP-binding protein